MTDLVVRGQIGQCLLGTGPAVVPKPPTTRDRYTAVHPCLDATIKIHQSTTMSKLRLDSKGHIQSIFPLIWAYVSFIFHKIYVSYFSNEGNGYFLHPIACEREGFKWSNIEWTFSNWDTGKNVHSHIGTNLHTLTYFSVH